MRTGLFLIEVVDAQTYIYDKITEDYTQTPHTHTHTHTHTQFWKYEQFRWVVLMAGS